MFPRKWRRKGLAKARSLSLSKGRAGVPSTGPSAPLRTSSGNARFPTKPGIFILHGAEGNRHGGLLRLLGDQAGVSLVEIVVSLALLGLVGVGLTLGLSTANLAVAQVRERNQAVHLAESQMEIIKASSFISTTVGVVVTGTYPIPAEVPGYTVTNTVTTLTTTLDTPYQIVTATQTGFELSGLKTRVTP